MRPPIICTKTVYHPNLRTSYWSSAEELINECRNNTLKQEPSQDLEITIGDNNRKEDFFDPKDVLQVVRNKNFSTAINITDQEIIRITNDVIRIFQNPQSLSKYLRPLDKELDSIMSQCIGINLNQMVKQQYIIAGQGSFMPGPPANDYQPLKKNHILDQILLRHEREEQINLEEEGIARFVGYVEPKEAMEFVSKGHLFLENEQIGRSLLHGKYTHRLSFEVIRQAVAMGDLDFNLASSGETLSHLHFLNLVTNVTLKINGKNNKEHITSGKLWLAMFDNFIALNRQENDHHNSLFNHENYDYSCISPFVFKSLLTCFGKELAIPNLQAYLLDSHWKQVERMKIRLLLQESNDINQIINIPDNISEDDFYSNLMIALAVGSDNPTNIGKTERIPFTITNKTAAKNPKYSQFTTHPSKTIKQKSREEAEDKSGEIPSNTVHTNYKSLEDYRETILQKARRLKALHFDKEQ